MNAVPGMVIGALLLSIGLLVGFIFGAYMRRLKTPRIPPPPEPICLCSHGYHAHEDGRKCRVEVYANYRMGRCACQSYVGPDPILSGLWMASEKPSIKE